MDRPQDSYKLFRSWVAQQKLAVDSGDKVWKFYDFGPKEMEPLIFIPGASGGAESFYKQFVSLGPRGYRLIAVQFPDYMTHIAFCKGFDKFLEKLEIPHVHLFGTSLGGYLALCYTQFNSTRVKSVILNNAFIDTKHYKEGAPCAGMFPWMPLFMLQKMVLGNFPKQKLDYETRMSVDFMVEQLESLTQSELASRLTLNCLIGDLDPSKLALEQSRITIMDTWDEGAVPEKLRDDVYKQFPDAKVATLKTGGNFPYLSRADEVNMFIQVHLRGNGVFVNDGSSARDSSDGKSEVES